MSRDVKLYIGDMLASSNKAISYIAEMSLESFEGNEQIYEAVLYNIFIVGEAANHVSEKLHNHYDEVPWRQIIGLRNIIAHAYHRLEPEIIWDLVTNDLPVLIAQLKQILDELRD